MKTKYPKYLWIIVIFLIIVIAFVIISNREKPIGGETDEHGCKLMAGYTWCESKQKCLRTWEEACAENFCDKENIQGVYICNSYIKVIGSLLGTGSTFYKNDLTEVRCPVVSPASMSEECKTLLEVTCGENICD